MDQRRRTGLLRPLLLRQARLRRDVSVGPGFERDYARRSGTQLSGREIVRAAAARDAHAVRAIETYHHRLARALGAIINVLDPDAIVLGGGVSNLPDLPAAATAILPRYVFSDTVATKIVRNAHGDSSGVRGAAWLWAPGETGP